MHSCISLVVMTLNAQMLPKTVHYFSHPNQGSTQQKAGLCESV